MKVRRPRLRSADPSTALEMGGWGERSFEVVPHRACRSGGGAAETLVYAPLAEALGLAARQSPEVQAGLYLQTPDDVVGYLDLVGD